ncbi:ATP-binding protein [Iamia majanohamensis]|uniref:histidine kinase n=1 Tax=Iamia majanohamensis TaxID=467976 RepID=A0AAF0BRJ9_9ACTN|nr:ATP-binding protein [Iamia majanohamensis]WCO66816.1 ATP-binding protein [Iamia majanohamensis]
MNGDTQGGTAFLVQGIHDEELLNRRAGGGDSDVVLTLAGFANTMTPGRQPPRISPSLWIHSREDLTPRNVLDDTSFLTEEEFWAADHQVVGEFNDEGQFSGRVTVFGTPHDYALDSPLSPRRSACGGFRLEFAVIQPRAIESRMPPSDHQRLDEKLRRFGGIYVYRDEIRVLPYGRPDYDWLDIEENRTKRLGSYFYSHRRMFGAVLLDGQGNERLEEKAGREGFQQNAAFRQLQRLIKNFLRQSAVDFFRESGDYGRSYAEQKDRANRKASAKRQRDSRVAAAQSSLAAEVATKYLRILDGPADSELAAILDEHRASIERSLTGDNPDAPEVILTRTRSQLKALQDGLRVAPSSEIPLTRTLHRDLDSYQVAYADFVNGPLVRARAAAEELVAQVATTSFRPDTQTVVREARRSHADRFRSAVAALEPAVERLSDRSSALEQAARQLIEDGILRELALDRLAGADGLDAGTYSTLRHAVETEVAELYEAQSTAVRAFVASVDRAKWWIVGEEIVTSSDEDAALGEELAELQQSADETLDLVQIGMALAVVDHEFGVTVRTIRESLRQLNTWADLNPSLAPLAHRLSATFDHLDGFLALLSPLQQRSNQRPTVMTGAEIYAFVAEVHRATLSSGEVELFATDEFLRHSFRGRRSVWYPVYVNLVDNAIYWVARAAPPRRIHLGFDSSAQALWVGDSGPGVGPEDVERIFEPRFSLKPGGRGLGLTIVRQVLSNQGFTISAAVDPELGGARFVIAGGEQSGVG